MWNHPLFRLFLVILVILIPFFSLINSINLLTSVEYRTFRNGSNEKQSLESRLERKRVQGGADLGTKIEDRLKAGTVEFVNPADTKSVIQLPLASKLPETRVPGPSSEPKPDQSVPGGVVIR